MNPLSLLPVKFYEILAVLVALAAFGGYMYRRGGIAPRAERDAVQARFIAFQDQVRQMGDAAKKAAAAKEKADQLAKENADARAKKLLADNADLGKRLRLARARSGYVPAAPVGSRSPDRACFDRAELERAIGTLDAGLQGIAGQGDAARLRLSTAAEWAASVGAMR